MPEYDVIVIVIGAGRAGLAAGHAIRTTDLSFRLLEAGGPWPRFYDSLNLFLPAKYCALPGLPFPATRGGTPHRDEAAAIPRQCTNHFALPVRTGSRVATVRRHAGGLVVELAGSEQLTARAVIAATGPFGAPQVPAPAGVKSYNGELLHTAAYRRLGAAMGVRDDDRWQRCHDCHPCLRRPCSDPR